MSLPLEDRGDGRSGRRVGSLRATVEIVSWSRFHAPGVLRGVHEPNDADASALERLDDVPRIGGDFGIAHGSRARRSLRAARTRPTGRRACVSVTPLSAPSP